MARGRRRGHLQERTEFSFFAREVLLPAEELIRTTGAGAAVLFAAAVAALVWANSPWGESYRALWSTHLVVDLGPLALDESFREFLNSGLMTLFFFVMGMEVKRELLEGELSEPRKAALPAMAAAGGMLVPVALYLVFNAGGEGQAGWGVPMATDIAFALGILALLGDRIPDELRSVMLTIAVADDVGTVLVIAVFYTSGLSLLALGIAAVLFLGVLALQRLGVRNAGVYWVTGIAVWFALHQSGVHATLAGVALGMATPISAPYSLHGLRQRTERLMDRLEEARDAGREEEAEVILGRMVELYQDTEPPLDRMERKVSVWSAFVVLPLFALANAGVPVSGSALAETVRSPVALGVAAGLVVGKPLGIVSFAWTAVRLRLARYPPGVRLRHVVGIGLIAGVGFTVSIFIAGLALSGETITTAKLAILIASSVAGAAGYLVLRGASRKPDGSGGTGGEISPSPSSPAPSSPAPAGSS